MIFSLNFIYLFFFLILIQNFEKEKRLAHDSIIASSTAQYGTVFDNTGIRGICPIFSTSGKDSLVIPNPTNPNLEHRIIFRDTCHKSKRLLATMHTILR